MSIVMGVLGMKGSKFFKGFMGPCMHDSCACGQETNSWAIGWAGVNEVEGGSVVTGSVDWWKVDQWNDLSPLRLPIDHL